MIVKYCLLNEKAVYNIYKDRQYISNDHIIILFTITAVVTAYWALYYDAQTATKPSVLNSGRRKLDTPTCDICVQGIQMCIEYCDHFYDGFPSKSSSVHIVVPFTSTLSCV